MTDSPDTPTPSVSQTGNTYPLRLGFGFVPRLFESSFWRMVLFYLQKCPQVLLKPSIFLGVGLTLPYVGLDVAMRQLTSHRTISGVLDIVLTFGMPIIVIGICSIGSIILAIWGLASCLVAVSAICRSFLTIDRETITGQANILSAEVQRTLDESLEYFRHRKAYLVTVWLVYSALMIIPTIVMFAAATVLMVGFPAVGSYTMLPGRYDVPLPLMIGSAITLGITVIAMSNYALVLMPYSAMANHKATQVAIKGLVLTLKTLPAISIYSAIVFCLSSFLAFPVDIMVIYLQDLAKNDFARYLLFSVKGVCHVFFFLYFLPISIFLPSEMIRGNLE